MAEHPTDFAPVDIKDGRTEGDWRSRYDKSAWKYIGFEAFYLLALLLAIPVLLAFVCAGSPCHWFGINEAQYQAALPSICAWLGGTLGGTLFDLKWLYHGVAKQIWHLDRILWRIFIPHLSAGVAFGTMLLIGSGIIRVFDTQSANSPRLVIGVSFLIGYFSDMAVAKLTEVAKTLFGPTRHLDETAKSIPPLDTKKQNAEPTAPQRVDGETR